MFGKKNVKTTHMKIRLEVDMLHYIDATPRGHHFNLLIVTHISEKVTKTARP